MSKKFFQLLLDADIKHQASEEVLLNAPALEPPFSNWPLGVDNATLELRKAYFRQAVDWGQLEEDCRDLPEEFILPVCCSSAQLRNLLIAGAFPLFLGVVLQPPKRNFACRF